MKDFLIISDIHCSADPLGAHNGTSYVSSKISDGDINHPFAGIRKALTGHSVDAVLCPGDITDKAEPDTLIYAWGALAQLSRDLNAELIACSGNHDLDSRHKHNADPAGLIMALRPRLPLHDRTAYLEYWAEKFTLSRRSDTSLLIVNTAAFHGGGPNQAAELEHGRISDHTLDKIRSALAETNLGSFGVLLCHHHLVRNNEVREVDYSEAIGGQALLEIIESTGKPWLVVHGHKHRPRVMYAQGGSGSPIILSAASFSANVRRDALNHAPNQMHLVSVDPGAASAMNLDLVGKVRSWNWLPNIGWKPAINPAGLPHESGFGARSAKSQIISDLKKLAVSHNGNVIKRAEILTRVPLLDYLLPQDLERVIEDLESDAEIALARNEVGLLAEIGAVT
ncbi:MAG: hypothetical protein CMF74_15765 [Maricaulis sp.]|jgi:3',5'-cyclic AMP phosphodiesterase CpdA|nr:hypothetical protein [Maricaulis sp.]|tara:strand:+ start:754 stop:1941 length:1188 start_codon:yes stop_codon:yes gene_type:complete